VPLAAFTLIPAPDTFDFCKTFREKIIVKKNCFLLMAATVLLVSGCSARRPLAHSDILQQYERPAVSLSIPQEKITVAVSPVRQTLQIGGTMTAVLGAGISALQDGHYARRIEEVLGEYDFGKVLADRLTAALEQVFPSPAKAIGAPGSTAGFHSIQAARKARLQGLQKRGFDAVLDLESLYGIYGAEGWLAIRLKGELIDLKTGKRLWRNDITAYTLDLYEGRRWRDPMERLSPNLMSPRFSSDRDAVEQWLRNDGEALRRAFELAAAQLAEAFLCDLGAGESAGGYALLGTNAFLDGKYEASLSYFRRARALAPEDPAIANGLVLALFHTGAREQALSLAESALATAPDYLPLCYNLAWWYGVVLKQPEPGQRYYDQSLSLGAHPARRLKRAFMH